MSIYKVPVCWSVTADLAIEANSLKEAEEKAEIDAPIQDGLSGFPRAREYVDGSFTVIVESEKDSKQKRKTYTIKPLEWYEDDNGRSDLENWTLINTCFGYYRVWWKRKEDGGSECGWSYTAVEELEEINKCESIENGKKQAEDDWLKKIEECLERVG